MPLIEGKSEESVHQNIKKLISEGKPRKQAVAIALETQREAKEKADDEINCPGDATKCIGSFKKPYIHGAPGAANTPQGYPY